jgi:hypothetical protein
MQAALVKLADENAPSTGVAIVSLLAGAAWTGIGIYFAFGQADAVGDDVGRAAGVTVSMLIGVPTLFAGVRGLSSTVTSSDEDRLERFSRERKAGALDALRLAHYEGELQADADISRKRRIGQGIGGIGTASAGGVLIALGATSKLEGVGRALTYVEGGLFVVVGTLSAIAQLTGESPNEREWRLYQKDQSTDRAPSVRIAIAPVVTRDGAAFGVVGSF